MIITAIQPASPESGQTIYVPSSTSFDNSERDIIGGLATIKDISYAYQSPFISIEEAPNQSFNYDILIKQQDKLKTQFGKQKASLKFHPTTVKIAKENLDEAISAAAEVSFSIASLPDIFNAGDKESIKVIGLALKRLQDKLNKKAHQ